MLRADLRAYLQEHASRFILTVTDSAPRELSAAQEEALKAQAEVERLEGELQRMRDTLRAEWERDQRRLLAAQEKVRKAQTEMERLNRELRQARTTIEGERQGFHRKLERARADVDSAQREVHRLQGALDATRRWYNGLPEMAPPNEPSQAREAVTYGAKMAVLNTALGELTAELTVCKETLAGLQRNPRLPPIEEDPRMVGLFAVRCVTSKGLAVAQESVAAIRRGLQLPIEEDPRMVGLLAAREEAIGALTLARQSLEKLKATLGELADLGAYISQHGLEALLNVRSASFEDSLDAAREGKVTVWAEVVFMGRPRSVSFPLDFHDPQEGAHALARALLPAR